MTLTGYNTQLLVYQCLLYISVLLMKPKNKLQFNHSNRFYVLSFPATISSDSGNTHFRFRLVAPQRVEPSILLLTLNPYLPCKLRIASSASPLPWLKHSSFPVSGKHRSFPTALHRPRRCQPWHLPGPGPGPAGHAVPLWGKTPVLPMQRQWVMPSPHRGVPKDSKAP